MSARAEFLRQMGLSEDDIVGTGPAPPKSRTTMSETQPPLPPARKATPSSTAAAPPAKPLRKEYSDDDEYDTPAPIPRRQSDSSMSSGVPTGNTASRKAFLASLGLSESDLMEETNKPLANKSSVTSSASGLPSKRASFSGDRDRSTPTYAPPEPSPPRSSNFMGSNYTSIPLGALEDTEEFPMPPLSSSIGGGAPNGRRKSKVPVDPALDAEAAKVTTPTIEQLKSFGNRYYDLGDFRKAVRYYGQAIRMDPDNAILYSNRSAAYLQGSDQLGMDTTSMALRDAAKACELRPSWAKAWARKGDALLQLGRPREAAESFQQALTIEPTNQHASSQLEKCGGYNNTTTSAYESDSMRGSANKSLDTLVSKLNEELTMSRKMSGKDYLEAERERFRLRRMGSGTPSVGTPSVNSEATADQSGMSSDAASAYRENLLASFRLKKTFSSSVGGAKDGGVSSSRTTVVQQEGAAIMRW